MNFTQLWSKAALLTAVTTMAGFASPLTMAQQPAPASVAPLPPELQTLDEGEPPSVTIRKPGEKQQSSGGDRIEERRDHGQIREIEVHSGPSTYYLKPKEQLGSALPGDAQSGPPTSAQWQVKEFDWDDRQQPENGDATNSPAK
jgi:hypothetical protein